jgi:hypothetical protein
LAACICFVWASASDTRVFDRVKSPDGWQEAREQLETCGAFCTAVDGVYIKARWLPLDGVMFSCAALTFDATEEHSLQLKWLDAHTLLIRHDLTPDQRIEASSSCGSTRVIFQPAIVKL